MSIEHQATLVFRDAHDLDEAVAIVRYGAGFVSLGLSLKSDGDIAVAMKKDDVLQLIKALTEAAQKA